MADKNKNGIPDDRERGVRFARGYDGSNEKLGIAGKIDAVNSWRGNALGPNAAYAPTRDNSFFQDRNRDLLNFFGDSTFFGMGPGAGMPQRKGTGFGDFLVGSNPNDTFEAMGRQRRSGFRRQGQGTQEGISPLSYAEALAQALGMVGGQQGGGIPFVNYDPERNAARQNASEADTRLAAMYRQLKGSIDADAPVIQASYQQAVDATNQNAGAAQQNIQNANATADARNSEVLANLGIQDAQAQIIGQGRDANTATAAQVADMAAAQQAATTNLTQNQAASVQQNRSIGSAAGLEGNLQRAQNQARLQALLAQIDSEEQNQNASIGAQNQSRGDGAFSTAMQLAGQLYGSNREDIDRQNQLQMQAIEMQQPNRLQSALGGLGQLLDPDAGLVKREDLNQDQLIKLILGLMK